MNVSAPDELHAFLRGWGKIRSWRGRRAVHEPHRGGGGARSRGRRRERSRRGSRPFGAATSSSEKGGDDEQGVATHVSIRTQKSCGPPCSIEKSRMEYSSL